MDHKELTLHYKLAKLNNWLYEHGNLKKTGGSYQRAIGN